jgi:hypothetical protein
MLIIYREAAGGFESEGGVALLRLSPEGKMRQNNAC